MNDLESLAYDTLNELLVELFNDILSIEERQISQGEFSDLSMREFHIIEQMAKHGKSNMGKLAEKLDVTVGTLTVALNHLVLKGYAKRERNNKDRRVVEIWLTDKGQRAEAAHSEFHKDMIDASMHVLTPRKLKVLVAALREISEYFKQKYK